MPICGQYSYGIYLTHPFALWIAFLVLGKWLDTTALRVVVTVAITGFSSVVLFHLVEDPLIRLGKRTAARLDTKVLIPQ